MRIVVSCLPVLFAIGCSGILGIPSDVERAAPDTEDAGPDAPTSDAMDASESDVDVVDAHPDAGPPLCDAAKEFGTPEPIDSVNTAEDEGAARMTDDELTMYIDGLHTANGPSYNIYFATRPTVNDPFGPYQSFPSVDSSIDTSDDEYAPNVTADGKSLIFERKTLATSDSNFYIATRNSPNDKFGPVSSISNLNTPAYEANPYLRDTATELWHVRKAVPTSADTDIALATFNPLSGYSVQPTDGQLENVSLVDVYDASPVISQNGLALYFTSDRPAPGGLGGTNIWVATRAARGGKFNVPVIVANVSSAANEYPGFISNDGCRLYLASNRTGGKGMSDIYMAKRPL